MHSTQHFIRAYDSDLHNLISILDVTVLAIEWFKSNCMKLNQDKRHFLISGHKYETVWANIGSCSSWESNDQKFPPVNIHCN